MYNRCVFKYKYSVYKVYKYPVNQKRMLQSEQSDFEKGLIILWYVFNLHRIILHFTVFYLDYIQNPTIVQLIHCVFPFFIFPYFDIYVFHLPVLSYFAWILCYGVGALDDRGETDVLTARDPGIPIKFTPSTPHCSAVQIQIHPNTSHYTEIPCTGCVWRLIKCRSLLRSVLSAFVRKRALGIPFIIQSDW